MAKRNIQVFRISIINLLLCALAFACITKETTNSQVGRPKISDYILAPATTEVLPSGAYRTLSKEGLPSTALTNIAKETVDLDAAIPEKADLIIDFGRIVGGRLFLEFKEIEEETKIRLDYAESSLFIHEGGDCGIQWKGPIPDTPILQRGTTTWKASDIRGGFRFVRMIAREGRLSLDRVSLIFTSFRTTEDALEGYFLSSDHDLNRIWYSGVYTLDLCTIDSLYGDFLANQRIAPDDGWVYVDGAKRDRMVWTADLYVESLAGLVSHYKPGILLRSIRALVSDQRPSGYIPAASPYGIGLIVGNGFGDYTAWWVRTLWSYYLHTGDGQPVKDLYPNVVLAMGYLESQRGASGLVEHGEQNNFDWCYSIIRKGASTYDNAVYILALAAASDMALINGDDENASLYQNLGLEIRRHLRKRLFKPERGVFVDTTVDSEHVPLDGNALALAIDGLLNDPEKRGILDYIRENMWLEWGSATVDRPYEETRQDQPYHNRRVWPFCVYLETEARFNMDDDESALDLVKRTWLSMLDYEGSGTFWEWIGPGVVPENCYMSLTHGVSAGITALISKYVMGVRPVDPGYKRFCVDPHPLGLSWFEGAIPTPSGPIKVVYETENGKGRLDIEFPSNIKPALSTPVREPISLVYFNGELSWER